MNKNIIIAAIVFLFSFLLTKGMSFYFMNNISKQTMKFVEEYNKDLDSLAVKDSVKVEEMKPEKHAEKSIEYIQDLKEKLDNDLQFQNIHKIPLSKSDSLRMHYTQELVKIAKGRKSILADFEALKKEIPVYKDSLTKAQEQIAQLKTQIDDLKNKKSEKKEAAQLEEMKKSYAKLAQTYDTMKAPAVAQIMMNLDDKTVVEVLNRMNERKVGKILESMPTVRASNLAKEIIRN